KGNRRSFDLAADGRTVAVLADRAEVRLFDTRTGKALRTIAAPEKGLGFVRLTADGRVLARHPDGRAWVWDAATGEPKGRVAQTPERFDYKAVLAPDGETVACREGPGRARVVLANWKTNATRGHTSTVGTIRSMAFSADGKMLALGRMSGTVAVHDAGTLTEI